MAALSLKGEGNASSTASSSQSRPADISYPTDDFWDVYITNVNSTVNVFLRLLGPEYSEKFENLATDMELHYFNEAAIPAVAKPEVGRLYAAKVDGEWHRVEVVDVQGIYVTCFYIDHGEREVVTVEYLKELDPKFLVLPAQAISVSLAGLEQFVDNSA